VPFPILLEREFVRSVLGRLAALGGTAEAAVPTRACLALSVHDRVLVEQDWLDSHRDYTAGDRDWSAGSGHVLIVGPLR
jgi:hypothetical protein